MLPSQCYDYKACKKLYFDVAKQYATETGLDELFPAASVLYGDTCHSPFSCNSLSV